MGGEVGTGALWRGQGAVDARLNVVAEPVSIAIAFRPKCRGFARLRQYEQYDLLAAIQTVVKMVDFSYKPIVSHS